MKQLNKSSITLYRVFAIISILAFPIVGLISLIVGLFNDVDFLAFICILIALAYPILLYLAVRHLIKTRKDKTKKISGLNVLSGFFVGLNVLALLYLIGNVFIILISESLSFEDITGTSITSVVAGIFFIIIEITTFIALKNIIKNNIKEVSFKNYIPIILYWVIILAVAIATYTYDKYITSVVKYNYYYQSIASTTLYYVFFAFIPMILLNVYNAVLFSNTKK